MLVRERESLVGERTRIINSVKAGLMRLGIRNFGFAPLRLPPELDFSALFHGVDERVPVEALEFGVRVLYRLLRDC